MTPEQELTALAKVVRLLDANKAKAAFLAPFALTVGATVTNWIVTGEFDTNELRLALGGLVASVVGSLATWWAPAGDAEVTVVPGSVEIGDEEGDLDFMGADPSSPSDHQGPGEPEEVKP